MALDKIDAVEAMVFGNTLVTHPTRVDMGELTPADVSHAKLWYSLLNASILESGHLLTEIQLGDKNVHKKTEPQTETIMVAFGGSTPLVIREVFTGVVHLAVGSMSS